MLDNIKAMCREKKTTLAEVERQCGLGTRTIYRWDECTPSIDKVKRVADFLECSVDELLKPVSNK